MPLYEASWNDAPSLLLCAKSTGAALKLLHDKYDATRLFELDDLCEIQPDNFLLVRRCGNIHPQQQPPLKFCPESSTRVFRVQHTKKKEECIAIVAHISELPSLVLWHYDLLTDEECLEENAVLTRWDEHNSAFSLLELNTTEPGILLRYDYCSCSHPELNEDSPFFSFKKDLK